MHEESIQGDRLQVFYAILVRKNMEVDQVVRFEFAFIVFVVFVPPLSK